MRLGPSVAKPCYIDPVGFSLEVWLTVDLDGWLVDGIDRVLWIVGPKTKPPREEATNINKK